MAAPPASAGRGLLIVGLAVAIVVVLVAGVWFLTRGSGSPTAAVATSTNSASTSPTTADDVGSAISPDPDATSSWKLKVTPSAGSATATSNGDDDLNRLTSTAASDKPRVEGLVGSWVPQVGSIRIGDQGSSGTVTAAEAWAKTDDLRSRFGAVVLNSSDYVYATSNYWVAVVPRGYSTAQDALDWCVFNGLDDDHCYAKYITHDSSVTKTSVHQK